MPGAGEIRLIDQTEFLVKVAQSQRPFNIVASLNNLIELL
jgi:hypothetical protein